MFFFNVSWTFVLVFLLVLGSDYRIPLSHHVLVAASTICAFPIWTATARAVVMCDMKPPGSAVYLEHFRSKVRDFIPSWPKIVSARGKKTMVRLPAFSKCSWCFNVSARSNVVPGVSASALTYVFPRGLQTTTSTRTRSRPSMKQTSGPFPLKRGSLASGRKPYCDSTALNVFFFTCAWREAHVFLTAGRRLPKCLDRGTPCFQFKGWGGPPVL